jgi:hypothetical protein
VSSQSRGNFLQEATQERLKLLCEQAAVEKHPETSLKLIREINDMLEAKRLRLSGVTTHNQSND